MDLVGSQASDGADRTVVEGELYTRKLRTPVILTLADDRSQYLCHCMVDTLHIVVPAGLVRAGGDFTNTKKLIIDDVRKL